MDSLVIVDCQYDFIDGSLACAHSHEAVAAIVDFVNSHDVQCLYTSDWHKPTNGSFKVNGGIWPVHCVQDTKGAELDPAFTVDIRNPANRPGKANRFFKGVRDDVEEYSAYNGVNSEGKPLADVLTKHVYVAGLATEYCVKETVLAILAAGHTVSLLTEGVGYVAEKDHKAALAEMKEKSVELL